MNERIRELIKQHGLNITIDGLGYGEGNVEGLAELIVRECVAICQDTDGEDNMDAKSGRQDWAVEIKEHFGLEE